MIGHRIPGQISDVSPDNGRGLSPRTDRKDLVSIPFWTNKSAKKQLKILAAEEECTQQTLLAQALNLLFLSKGLEPLA
jgi:hypothetical protein